MTTINKTHSKLDLIELIVDLDLPIVYSHQDAKKDIQIKLLKFLKNTIYQVSTQKYVAKQLFMLN